LKETLNTLHNIDLLQIIFDGTLQKNDNTKQ